MSSMPPWALIIIGLLAVVLGLAVAQSADDGDGTIGVVVALAGAVTVIAGVERGWKERGR
jgi:hypothetical protein